MLMLTFCYKLHQLNSNCHIELSSGVQLVVRRLLNTNILAAKQRAVRVYFSTITIPSWS